MLPKLAAETAAALPELVAETVAVLPSVASSTLLLLQSLLASARYLHGTLRPRVQRLSLHLPVASLVCYAKHYEKHWFTEVAMRKAIQANVSLGLRCQTLSNP